MLKVSRETINLFFNAIFSFRTTINYQRTTYICNMAKNSNTQWILFAAIALLWIVIIQVAPRFLPFNFSKVVISGIRIHTDYFTHIVLFVVIVIVIDLLRVKLNPMRVFLALLCVAVIAEVVQLYIPKRTFNYWDMVSNIAGVMIGGILVWIWKKQRVEKLKAKS